eukprot:gene22933-27730_t
MFVKVRVRTHLSTKPQDGRRLLAVSPEKDPDEGGTFETPEAIQSDFMERRPPTSFTMRRAGCLCAALNCRAPDNSSFTTGKQIMSPR